MKVMGPTVTVKIAEESVGRVLYDYNLQHEQLHMAQLFHGSSSASLLAFTSYSNYEGALLPIGLLEKKGKVSFSGEIVFGRGRINAVALSTMWIRGIHVALHYAEDSLGWNLERGSQRIEGAIRSLRENIEGFKGNPVVDGFLHTDLKEKLERAIITGDFEGLKERVFKVTAKIKEEDEFPQYVDLPFVTVFNPLEVNFKRKKEWERLSLEEQALVSDPFPVLYGIKSSRKEVHVGVRSDPPGEIGLIGGAQRGEIKVIFVHPSKVSFVKELLQKAPGNVHANIPVEALECFNESSRGGPSS
jgi:hypothetical protein